MKKTNKRNNIVIVLIVLLLALAIGYAAFSSTLNLTGHVSSGSANWSIQFVSGALVNSNGTEDTTHGTLTTNITKGVSTNDTMEVSGIELAYPGDGALLQVKVKNFGTIPAKLSDFTIDTDNDTDYTVTKAAGGPNDEETLAAGETCIATFLVKWNADSVAESLSNKTFTITYDYDQDTTEFTGTPSHSHS